MSSGQAITGAVVSSTVTVNIQEVELFAASVAVQVTSVIPSGNVDPDEGTQVTAGLGSLESTASAANVRAVPLGSSHSAVMFCGHVITGAFASATVTIVSQVRLFPAASVTVIVTVCGPMSLIVPGDGLWDVVRVPAGPQVSVALMPPERSGMAACTLSSAGTVVEAGQARSGGDVSLTVTVKLQEDELPSASVAVHATVVVPNGNVDPGFILYCT
jgi:hypothetical protein